MKNLLNLPLRNLAVSMCLLLLMPAALFAQPLFKPAVLYTVGNGPHSVFAADLDGDGDEDIVVANLGVVGQFDGTTVSIFENNGGVYLTQNLIIPQELVPTRWLLLI